MKKYLFIFCIISFSSFSQEIKLLSASRQTINSGASPTSTTNYKVTFEKNKKFIWSIDSICGIQSGNRVNYNIVKTTDATVLSPDYAAVTTFHKADIGKYMIRFSITKQRGSGGRPGGPQNLKVDTTNIEGGIVIYYSSKKKKKQLKVIDFEMLETVDAP